MFVGYCSLPVNNKLSGGGLEAAQPILVTTQCGCLMKGDTVPAAQDVLIIKLPSSLPTLNTAPAITLVTKKGSQQMMNTPITVPSVLAAFVSLENLTAAMLSQCSQLFYGKEA